MGKKIILLLCRCCSQQNQKDQKLNMTISGSSRSSRVSSVSRVSRERSRSPIRRSVPPQRGVAPPPPPTLLPSGVPMPPPVPSGVPSRRIVGGDDAVVEYVPSPMQPPPLPPPRHPPPPAVPGPRMRSSCFSHELPPPPLPGAVLPSPLVTGQACVLVPRRDSDAHLALRGPASEGCECEEDAHPRKMDSKESTRISCCQSAESEEEGSGDGEDGHSNQDKDTAKDAAEVTITVAPEIASTQQLRSPIVRSRSTEGFCRERYGGSGGRLYAFPVHGASGAGGSIPNAQQGQQPRCSPRGTFIIHTTEVTLIDANSMAAGATGAGSAKRLFSS